ncbi:histo-blood group ABO system transferase-like [Eulemur rufifrons]|uniref:histo-blood group ABO system transferase-like n=1 Tax=Eulemur rufifrons TaxID=859984 RepID=UPI00374376AF
MAQLLQVLAGKQKCCLLPVTLSLLMALILAFLGYSYLNPQSQELKSMLDRGSRAVRELHHQQRIKSSRMVYPQPDVLTPSRPDVLVVTPWLAPIVWEGTFNTDILNEQFWLQNATIGLTMFAMKKYMVFLKQFLESAERYFMVGHRVNYYIFTDQPDHVPRIQLHRGRQMVILKAQSYARWQDISMRRMQVISNFSQERFLGEVDYLVCTDVDMKFSDHVGVEILSSLFGTLHPDYYGTGRNNFAYERRPQSQAYIPGDEGDFYYIGAFFGGSVPEVHRLTKACHQAMMIDQANDIEALWHDESHLNKYLLHHKPTKVLSPEYMCDNELMNYMSYQQLMGSPTTIKRRRIVVLAVTHRCFCNHFRHPRQPVCSLDCPAHFGLCYNQYGHHSAFQAFIFRSPPGSSVSFLPFNQAHPSVEQIPPAKAIDSTSPPAFMFRALIPRFDLTSSRQYLILQALLSPLGSFPVSRQDSQMKPVLSAGPPPLVTYFGPQVSHRATTGGLNAHSTKVSTIRSRYPLCEHLRLRTPSPNGNAQKYPGAVWAVLWALGFGKRIVCARHQRDVAADSEQPRGLTWVSAKENN